MSRGAQRRSGASQLAVVARMARAERSAPPLSSPSLKAGRGSSQLASRQIGFGRRALPRRFPHPMLTHQRGLWRYGQPLAWPKTRAGGRERPHGQIDRASPFGLSAQAVDRRSDFARALRRPVVGPPWQIAVTVMQARSFATLCLRFARNGPARAAAGGAPGNKCRIAPSLQ